MSVRLLTLGIAAVLTTGCGGAGPYGYDREYVLLDAEEPHAAETTEVTYEEVRRKPGDFAGTTVGWFGVVTAVDVDASGSGVLSLNFRILQPRNLCADERASSCRVTVSGETEHIFEAKVALREEDRVEGRDRLWAGSLVKVYGEVTPTLSDAGGVVVDAEWYRHWPRGTYRTTASAGVMRR